MALVFTFSSLGRSETTFLNMMPLVKISSPFIILVVIWCEILRFVQDDTTASFVPFVKFKVIVKLILEVLHLVDIFILDGDVIILPHGTQLVL